MISALNSGPLGNPPRLPDGSLAPLSPGFVSGNFLFLSGQLSFQDGGILNDGNIETQTAICLANIDKQLKTVSLQRTDIVKVTAWIVSPEDFGGFNAAYSAFFGAHRPARSTVCAGLLVPGARVEIEAIAQVGAAA